MKKALLIIVGALMSVCASYGATYTWNGSGSSAWTNTANWTPVGTPTAADNVIFNAVTPNICLLDIPRTITNLTLSNGTLNLNSLTLTLNTFTSSGGTIQNGELSAVNFNNVSATNFAGVITLRKTAGGNNNWTGGNTFDNITIINEDDNRIRLAVTNGDTFNGPARFVNSNTNFIDVAYSGTTSFANNVTIDNTSTGYIRFGQNNGTSAIAAPFALLTNGYNSGNLYLYNLTQNGTTANGTFSVGTFTAINASMGGNMNITASVALTLNNCSFTATNTLTAFNITLSNANNLSTASGSSTITKTDGGNNTWDGGNTFGPTRIINLDDSRIRLANATGDTFLNTATFEITNTGNIDIAYNGSNQFNNNVILHNTSSGTMSFGQNGGTSVIQTGFSLQTTSFNSGNLIINNLTQNGTAVNSTFNPNNFTAVNTTLGGNIQINASGNIILNGSTFSASNVITGLNIQLANANNLSLVSGTTTITKTGGTNDTWDGGNTFGALTIINQSTNRIRMANVTGDTFLNVATFENTNTNFIDIAYSGNSIFNNNVTLNNTSTGTIRFGQNGGTSTIQTGFSIQTTSFNSGNLIINNLTQNGTAVNSTFNPNNFTAVNTTLGGNIQINTSGNIVLNGSTFSASNVITGLNIQLANANNLSLVSGTTTITKTGGTNDTWDGGNTFGPLSITNQSTNRIRMANVTGDNFIGAVSFVQANTGAIQAAFNGNNLFYFHISTIGSVASINFGIGTGVVTIAGNTNQNISGDATFLPIINRLTMASAAGGGATLLVPININIALLMTTGILNSTLTNIPTLTNETVNSSIGNANAYVNGPMNYQFTSNSTVRSTLNFPIGKGADWRPAVLQVAHTNNTSYTYRAEVSNASAHALGWTLPAGVDRVSAVHYWDIDRLLTSTMASVPSNQLRTTAADGPIITLYYGVNDKVDDPANLVICKNTAGAPTTWINIGGNAVGAPSGSVTSVGAPSPFDSFSRFTLGGLMNTSNPLPVQFVSFVAKPINNTVELTWSTASELNNNYFEVQRSLNGIDWITLENIQGAGTSTILSNYSVVDFNPINGQSYYRIKQVDYNFTATYSEIKSVQTIASLPEKISLYPNPTIDFITLIGASTLGTNLKLITIEGKDITDSVTIFSSSPNSIVIDLRLLPTGSYLLLSTAGAYKIAKF